MKKKGFTLIELLAVIVILAIIAVITVPKIADMITSSRQGGAEDSFYGTLKAAELGYTKALQTNTSLKGSTCTIEDSKITCTNGVNIEVSGKTPESGVIAVSSNGASVSDLSLNGYKCTGTLSSEKPCVKNKAVTDVDKIKKTIVMSGDGLYVDEYENNRYIYKGKNPDNYIKFNNEDWRIVSIEDDNTLKIVRMQNVGKRPFDANGNRDSGSNGAGGTYCASSTHGCNVWAITDNFSAAISGSVLKDSSIKTYLNGDYYNSLSSEAKSQIQSHDFNYGYISTSVNTQALIKLEKKYKWKGNIGLISVSDYLRSNTNKIQCEDATSLSQNKDVCKDTNYLLMDYHYVINSFSHSNTALAYIYSSGMIGGGYSDLTDHTAHPVVYLKSNINISGSGTSINPYTIN